jgi:predicted transcriptional regulator
MQLSKTEEQLMQYLWKRKKAFLKDLLADFPESKPATTTVATLLKRITDKGYITYNLFGKSREYYPLIKKTDYFSTHVIGLIKDKTLTYTNILTSIYYLSHLHCCFGLVKTYLAFFTKLM